MLCLPTFPYIYKKGNGSNKQCIKMVKDYKLNHFIDFKKQFYAFIINLD